MLARNEAYMFRRLSNGRLSSHRVELRPGWDEDKDYPYCACGLRFVPLYEGAERCVMCIKRQATSGLSVK